MLDLVVIAGFFGAGLLPLFARSWRALLVVVAVIGAAALIGRRLVYEAFCTLTVLDGVECWECGSSIYQMIAEAPYYGWLIGAGTSIAGGLLRDRGWLAARTRLPEIIAFCLAGLALAVLARAGV